MSKFGKLITAETADLPSEKAPQVSKTARATKPVKAKAEMKSAPTIERKLTTGGAYRDNPNLVQVSGYIHRETHKAVRKTLIDDGRDFSLLLQDLLEAWLVSRQSE